MSDLEWGWQCDICDQSDGPFMHYRAAMEAYIHDCTRHNRADRARVVHLTGEGAS